ncbi:hypothetical protein COCSUDRAFT_83539 [Coccomyxa subellipsoidea C-169]|uniref:RRM domain-containing protein n=1 Tax=Coccomyxa subellipsoidea (strain C-169) TaxID=574566 RepID=I0YQF2_COCSC|nr:hypothetical protein COCSUDRAFT_83539 [Coccomyxa subellipsoidea C-169]EIE20621.1 hypothetical protein COCSUDRAFT_83539 [Coccomyxa subellipsoidea C-169]|eukprot:XP_005645165.1 hypothetical protein COCSUDRAFT_83539 [Coccomyxa subellipsoidea C-169]
MVYGSQQQTPVQQRPPQQLAQGNVSSLAFGMDTVQQSATAQRPARPAAAQSYPNSNFIPVAGSVVTPQQPTPQQQQQQQEQVRAVRAAIIQQQGSNLGLPQGYGSPGYQGQAMNGQRPGPQVEIVQPEAEEEEVLPPEANPTLFLSGLPLKITKREVAHILRPCEGFKELRLVQKVDRNNKDVMWCFAEFSSKQLAARAMNDLQGYAVDLDDQDSPTLRISYARALNNPKVREGRAAAEEPRSSTPLEVRVDRPQPYRHPRSPLDPRGSRDMMRGPAEPYGQVQHHREPDLIPVDPRRDVRGRPQPRDATPNRRDAYEIAS